MNEEMIDCPFCGHADELQVSHFGAADEWWWQVFCDHCCTYGPTAQTEAEAIAAWNTRAYNPNERLREALEWYAEQVAGCRKLGRIGDPFRHALDADGGKRALEALSPLPQREDN